MDEVKLPIPREFRRGILANDEAASVNQGIELLNWVAQSRPLQDSRILDFGCGVKIAQALYQLNSPQSLYLGVDVYREMIAHISGLLQGDQKYQFETVPFQNDMYNPDGTVMTAESRLPVEDGEFDILLMFSVITHMAPEHSAAVFKILHGYAAPQGRLFFWANVDDAEAQDFRNDDPQRPLQRAMYRRAFLEDLLLKAGWRIEKVSLNLGVGNIRPHTQGHYICAPAQVGQ